MNVCVKVVLVMLIALQGKCVCDIIGVFCMQNSSIGLIGARCVYGAWSSEIDCQWCRIPCSHENWFSLKFPLTRKYRLICLVKTVTVSWSWLELKIVGWYGFRAYVNRAASLYDAKLIIRCVSDPCGQRHILSSGNICQSAMISCDGVT